MTSEIGQADRGLAIISADCSVHNRALQPGLRDLHTLGYQGLPYFKETNAELSITLQFEDEKLFIS